MENFRVFSDKYPDSDPTFYTEVSESYELLCVALGEHYLVGEYNRTPISALVGALTAIVETQNL